GIHLGEPAALGLGHELAPRHTLGVAAAGQTAPVIGLRTDPHRVLVTAHGLVGAGAAAADLEVGAHLLRPGARHAAADREDAEDLVLADPRREVVEVVERVERQRRLAGLPAQVIVDRDVQPELAVGERGYVHGDAAVECAAQHAAPDRLLFQRAGEPRAERPARP